jgi:stearoyl-CoA desaturase (delta-9 desaturase)
MIFGSTAKNINLITLITAAVVLLYGVNNYYIFTLENLLLTIIGFYVLNILGIWLTYHRYFSHHAFKFKNKFLEWIFTIIGLLAGRGSPLGWVYLHRKHHRYSDTDKDPHSPAILGFKMFGFGHMKKIEQEEMQLFLVKDMMTATHLFLHKYYILLLVPFLLLLGFINFELLYFLWAIPALMIQLSISVFNYFGHIIGYKNYNTNDNSYNNFWLFPLLLGEAWHNNHHAYPQNKTTKVKKFEFDPVHIILKAVSK